jgi:Putative quorum-sensing-regulated virulence factor
VKMPFGKFKGQPVEDLPPPYLHWLWENIELRDPLYSAVRAALGEKPATGSTLPAVKVCARDIVVAGYRVLAKSCHPDHGGSHEDMVNLNKAKELLDKAAA